MLATQKKTILRKNYVLLRWWCWGEVKMWRRHTVSETATSTIVSQESRLRRCGHVKRRPKYTRHVTRNILNVNFQRRTRDKRLFIWMEAVVDKYLKYVILRHYTTGDDILRDPTPGIRGRLEQQEEDASWKCGIDRTKSKSVTSLQTNSWKTREGV